MKNKLCPVVGFFALLLPTTVTQAAPKPAAALPRILVTLQVLEVPSSAAPRLVPDPSPVSGVYDTLLKNNADEGTEVSVQTTNDFPGIARYSRVLAWTTHTGGKAERNFLTIPTSLEATPHINADGTITVRLNMEVTRTVPPDASAAADAPPRTTSQSMTALRTFKSGETLLFGGTALTIQNGKPGRASPTKELLQFVTVTVLPDKIAAR